MPITFHRYGRRTKDPNAPTCEEQAAATRKEFERQIAAGLLPPDTVDGGFMADTDLSPRSKVFACRPAGCAVSMNCRPGDRICVTAYDRLISSTRDACWTLDWARNYSVGLVFMDLPVDTLTPEGQRFIEWLRMIKGYERNELSVRCKHNKDLRQAHGMVRGGVPLGYQIKTIIPVRGGRVKWYFPWIAERNYGERIVKMHDEDGLSFDRIATEFWIKRVAKPRTGKVTANRHNTSLYYSRCKEGWPLSDGVQWKPPDFRYHVEGRNHEVDLLRDVR